jgi:hypothetical protein
LRWQIPQDNGGCNLTGFNLFRDDGNAGSISIEVAPSDINNKPSLTSHLLQFTATETGKQFKFQLQTSNAEGSQISSVAAYIIADNPDKPLLPPRKIQSNSDNQSLFVKVDPYQDTENGGTSIIGYLVQVDDGQAGPFSTVLGTEIESGLLSLETEVLVKDLM